MTESLFSSNTPLILGAVLLVCVFALVFALISDIHIRLKSIEFRLSRVEPEIRRLIARVFKRLWNKKQ